MNEKIALLKKKLGDKLLILAHHYQPDSIIQYADFVGDSLKLAQAAAKSSAEYIVFCGVHFMAETAEILTADGQRVFEPILSASCQMANMADIQQAEDAWNLLSAELGGKIAPITYVNSTAEIKAFCGKHNGAVVTSSNAEKLLKWGLDNFERILFLPDKNLGRNTALSLGIPADSIALYNRENNSLEYCCKADDVRIILWNGYCYVHDRIEADKAAAMRKKYPGITITVHPECSREVVSSADSSGSTEFIIKTVEAAEDGAYIAVGTERNLVERLIEKNKNKNIFILDKESSCDDMNYITEEKLLETLEQITKGDFSKQTYVDSNTAKLAALALNKMLELS